MTVDNCKKSNVDLSTPLHSVLSKLKTFQSPLRLLSKTLLKIALSTVQNANP